MWVLHVWWEWFGKKELWVGGGWHQSCTSNGAAFILLKSDALLCWCSVGASSIIKSPSGCRLKKNLLSANEIDTSLVQGHCSWFAPAWKWAPRYFMGQCSAHNLPRKASRCHCIWITFPSALTLNPSYTLIYKVEIWENTKNASTLLSPYLATLVAIKNQYWLVVWFTILEQLLDCLP